MVQRRCCTQEKYNYPNFLLQFLISAGGGIFLLFVNRSIRTHSAKNISSRITRRILEHTLGWGNNRVFYVSWITLIIIGLIFSVIVFNWAKGIGLADVQQGIDVSVRKLDNDRLEVMVVFIGKDTMIRYLTYSTMQGSGFINRSTDPFDHVRDIGETGIIPLSGYSGRLEIFATLENGKTMKIYEGSI